MIQLNKWLLSGFFFLTNVSLSVAQPTTSAEFFAGNKLYVFEIKHWSEKSLPLGKQDEWVEAEGPELNVYQMTHDSSAYCPDTDSKLKPFYQTRSFQVKNSGNKTKGTAKASIKIKLAKKQELAGQKIINLKSMWNDPSMMREALAWDFFAKAQIPASRLSYAKLCVNNVYQGVFAIIENVDETFLQDRLGKKAAKGNLYKASWGDLDLGPATLAVAGQGRPEDYTRQADNDERTYALKTNEDDVALNDYSDLAQLIKAIAKAKTHKDYSELESMFDIKSFLRWAGVNMLIGAWDNYLRTGANFHLYNTTRPPEKPYFIWVPWDYDNSFGIVYEGDDIDVDWSTWPLDKWTVRPGSNYQRPLIEALLAHSTYRDYYRTFIREFARSYLDGKEIDQRLRQLYALLSRSVYQESDCPTCRPFTGRQFSNDTFYRHVMLDEPLKHANSKVMGIRQFIARRLKLALQY